MYRVLCLQLLTAALCIGGVACASSDKVKIDSGVLQGSEHEGVLSFKGIPYAAAPVGNLRWEPPQPVVAWSGVRSATSFGHDCMQLPSPNEAAPAGTTTPGEDCL
jgi:para-nitrobenzyl esterase